MLSGANRKNAMRFVTETRTQSPGHTRELIVLINRLASGAYKHRLFSSASENRVSRECLEVR